MAPTDIGFGIFEFLLCLLAFAHFEVVQARAQALPGYVFVAVLAASVLALHDDARWDVR